MRGVPARDHARGRRRPPRGDLMIRRSAHARLLSVLPLVALALAACARNPVTGKREFALVSKDQEIALGKESAEQVKAQMGVYPDEKVQAYVREIGLRMAKASERPDLPWQFNVLDDATVNAFALPGGPVFITRGHPHALQLGGGARERARPRDRSHHGAPLGRAALEAAARAARARRRDDRVAGARAVRAGGRRGAAAALPQVRAGRRAAGRPARLQVHGGAGLRRRARWRRCS